MNEMIEKSIDNNYDFMLSATMIKPFIFLHLKPQEKPNFY